MGPEGATIATAVEPPKSLGWLRPSNLLGTVIGTLAIVALVRQGAMTYSFSAPMQGVLAAYEAAKNILFGWTEPYLRAGLDYLTANIGLKFHLFNNWKDYFIVCALMGNAMGRAEMSQRKPSNHKIADLSFRLYFSSFGLIFAFGFLAYEVVFGAIACLIGPCSENLDEFVTKYTPIFLITVPSFLGILLLSVNRRHPHGWQIINTIIGTVLFFVIDAGIKLLS